MKRAPLLEAIFQSAAVGLFEAFNLAVAPVATLRLPASRVLWSDPTAVSLFEGKSVRGSLLLSIPDEAYGLMPQSSGRATNQGDFLRELNNQLTGRVSNRLNHFQTPLRCGVPLLLDDASRKRRFKDEEVLLYAFRTLRGELNVGFHGTMDEAALVYSDTSAVHREGDVLVF